MQPAAYKLPTVSNGGEMVLAITLILLVLTKITLLIRVRVVQDKKDYIIGFKPAKTVLGTHVTMT